MISWARARSTARASPAATGWAAPGPIPATCYKLLSGFRPKVHLEAGETWKDAAAGAAAVALKRASLFGRAPVVHDLTVGFGVWGFLDDDPDGELLKLRRDAFAGISHPADYTRLRRVVDAVPEETLRLPHAEGAGRACPELAGAAPARRAGLARTDAGCAGAGGIGRARRTPASLAG